MADQEAKEVKAAGESGEAKPMATDAVAEAPGAEKAAQGGGKGGGRGGGKKKKKLAKQDYLQTPKGTKDYDPKEMLVRERMLNTISATFKKFGARRIETPVFELKETLTGKYGEDSKLIFDLADQGGQLCALRYDLTVPFARYVAMNRIKQMKRYQISRVYRRDQPAMNRGRFREFYQCDFDLAGEYDRMVADAETCAVMVDALANLDVGEFRVKINHRLVLDGMMELCGVPDDLFRGICSAIDKLDKAPWEEVRNEMVNEKGLAPEVADRIKPFTDLNGSYEDVAQRVRELGLFDNAKASEGLADLELLFTYLQVYGIADRFSFDMSLARGLDYYTGVIFEAVLTREKVGSVAGGGRYDKLVGIFGSNDIPAVGFSLGVERLFTVLMKRQKKARECDTQVFVASIDKNLLEERMRIVAELRAAGISAELLLKLNPRIKPQLGYAEEHGIPVAVVIGGNEVAEGKVNVKVLAERKQVTVARSGMVEAVRTALAGELLCDAAEAAPSE